jgi:hypothetical protein
MKLQRPRSLPTSLILAVTVVFALVATFAVILANRSGGGEESVSASQASPAELAAPPRAQLTIEQAESALEDIGLDVQRDRPVADLFGALTPRPVDSVRFATANSTKFVVLQFASDDLARRAVPAAMEEEPANEGGQVVQAGNLLFAVGEDAGEGGTSSEIRAARAALRRLADAR